MGNKNFILDSFPMKYIEWNCKKGFFRFPALFLLFVFRGKKDINILFEMMSRRGRNERQTNGETIATKLKKVSVIEWKKIFDALIDGNSSTFQPMRAKYNKWKEVKRTSKRE